MASFTGVGDNTSLTIPRKGENISIAISGTYNMTIALQREIGSPGSGSWATLKTYSTANATVADTYQSERDNESIRLIVTVYTSGTATATLTDSDNRSLGAVKDGPDGNSVLEYKQRGIKVRGAVERANGVAAITAATTLTAEEHAGCTIVFNDADGATVTLPAATGTGNLYRFFVAITVTSNSDKIKVANATDIMAGNIIGNSTGDTPDLAQPWPTAADSDTITLNGSTKGGILGDWIELEDVAAGLWSVRGIISQSGIEETPFSAAVS